MKGGSVQHTDPEPLQPLKSKLFTYRETKSLREYLFVNRPGRSKYHYYENQTNA